MRRWLIQKLIFPYWRYQRGMTLGVQGLITRDDSEVLLVRHGYQPGWHFPGGGVEWRETLLAALAREVEEETGIIVKGEPRLHGIFANFRVAPSDHVILYRVNEWDQPKVPDPNFEIQEQRFFPLSELPDTIARGPQRRLQEIYHGNPIGQHW